MKKTNEDGVGTADWGGDQGEQVAVKGDMVVKSNRLVEASYRMALREQQLVLYAICRSREEQRGLSATEPVTITAKEFGAKFGIDESNVYRELKDASDGLFERRIVIRDIHPKTGKPRVVKTRWISDAAYIDAAGMVEITFAPKVVPYITRLEGRFTMYLLTSVAQMTSAHAVRVYELLRQYLKVGSREFALVELKALLGVAGEYKAIKDFKLNVLDVACKQINLHSDIRVKYDGRKTGRAITHIVFTIKPAKAKAKAGAGKAKTVGARARPALTKAYIDSVAKVGETYESARLRIIRERELEDRALKDAA